jgi:hypothetical protein
METSSYNEANRWTILREKKHPNKRKALVLAATVALALGNVCAVFAQGTQGAVGGTTTDMTSAGNANGVGLPQIERNGAVEYVSGGVGLDESTAFRREQARWPLAMRFTGPTADYLADVHVRIVDPRGAEVLSTDSRGPYMLAKLPPGNYTVHARYEDEEQTRTVTVSSRPGARADFHWSDH